jgi:hypothetical protein
LGCYDPISCQTCESGITTSHHCDTSGKAFCVFCTEKWGSELPNKRGKHLPNAESSGSVSEDECSEEDTSNEVNLDDDVEKTKKQPLPPFIPDYVKVQAISEMPHKDTSKVHKKKFIGLDFLNLKSQNLKMNLSFHQLSEA